MKDSLLKKSRDALVLLLREHDDIDSNTKRDIENLIKEIEADLGKQDKKLTKRELLSSFGVLLTIANEATDFVEFLMSFKDSL